MKIYTREHASQTFETGVLNRFLPHPSLCSAFPAPHSLSGCQTDTSVVIVYANNRSLPTTCHIGAAGNGKSDNPTYVAQVVGVEEGSQNEIRAFCSRALSQLPLGQHPCPCTYGMEAQG